MINRRFLLYAGLAFSLLAFDSCIAVHHSKKVEVKPTAETVSEVSGLTVKSPQADRFLPDYPAFEDKDAFYRDSIMYERGLQLRDTPRGEVAKADAATDMDFFMNRFGEAMGIGLTKETAPAIAAYIETTYTFARSGISNAKNAYHRLRPYGYFEEESRSLGYDRYQSYPSGHSVRAWSIALALAAIDEEHQYEILKTGYQMGESRVITGHHYESDVEAARLAASAAFARLVSDKYYLKLMDKAKAELDGIKSKTNAAI